MKLLDAISGPLVGLTFILLAVFLVNWSLFMYRQHLAKEGDVPPRFAHAWTRFPTRTLKIFLVIGAIDFAIYFLSAAIARHQVLRTIDSLSPGYTTFANGHVVQTQGETVKALRNLHWALGHHSHPTTTIDVIISDGSKRITLVLARDSEDHREYWVFFPEYSITSQAEIGRIKTNAFDGY